MRVGLRLALLLSLSALAGCDERARRCPDSSRVHAEAIRECTQIDGCRLTAEDIHDMHDYDRDCVQDGEQGQ